MKISIITVTYNSAQTLTRTIRSVCRQSYKDIEYIIVDGESADTTMTIVKEFAEQYPFIRYVSEPDNGIYDAINKGIQMATGSIIGLVNSDDVLADNDTITHIVERFKKERCDILYGDLQYVRYEAIEHNPPRVVRYWRSNDFSEHLLSYGWMPPHPTLYCRRSVFNKVGLYRTDFRISADYEFILRAFSHREFRTSYLPEVIIRMETGGVSNRDFRAMTIKTQEDFRALRMNGRKPFLTVLCKNLRKTRQFFRKK